MALAPRGERAQWLLRIQAGRNPAGGDSLSFGKFDIPRNLERDMRRVEEKKPNKM